MVNLNNHDDKQSHKRENEEGTRNIYGGDTSNFGNASQGGVDPAKWKEVPEKAADKSEDAERSEDDNKRSED